MSYYPFDINNVPEDATHYTGKDDGNTALFFYKKINGNWMYACSVREEWTQCSSGRPAINPIPIVRWSVYNNTMPLCELTDEQYGKMRRMSDAGMDVEWRSSAIGRWELLSSPTWNADGVYRIKPKSERELFIETTTKVMRDAGTKCPDKHEYFGIMFDAGARYKDLTQHFGENI